MAILLLTAAVRRNLKQVGSGTCSLTDMQQSLAVHVFAACASDSDCNFGLCTASEDATGSGCKCNLGFGGGLCDQPLSPSVFVSYTLNFTDDTTGEDLLILLQLNGSDFGVNLGVESIQSFAESEILENGLTQLNISMPVELAEAFNTGFRAAAVFSAIPVHDAMVVSPAPSLPSEWTRSFFLSNDLDDASSHNDYLTCFFNSFNALNQTEMIFSSEEENNRVLVSVDREHELLLNEYVSGVHLATLSAECHLFGRIVNRPAEDIAFFRQQEFGFDHSLTEYLTNPSEFVLLDLNADGLDDLLVLKQGTALCRHWFAMCF